MIAQHDDTTLARRRAAVVARDVGREKLTDLLRWHRIPGGLRYWRRHGLMALLRRLFPWLRFYSTWVKYYDRRTAAETAAIRHHMASLASRPLISVLLPVVAGDRRFLARAVAGVAAQLYSDWELCVAGDPAVIGSLKGPHLKIADAGPNPSLAVAYNAALATAGGALVTLVRAADKLPPHALYVLALEHARHPDAAILYSDEDTIGFARRRHAPRFKTEWNPDLLLGHDAVGRMAAYSRDLVHRLGGLRSGFDGAEEYDLALRAGEAVAPERIRHIPMILCHRRRAGEAPAAAHCRAVADHLARTGCAAAAEPLAGARLRIRHKLPDPPPPVSLVIATRDQGALLRRCVNGLLNDTDYDHLEIVIVDNDSAEAATHAYFAELGADPRVRIVRFPGPFNYSAINNYGVAQARHEIVGLLNNDIEVIHADWLKEMVSHAVRPEIGAVGAKLYYPHDRIQSAGTIVGLGGAAGHAFRHFRRTAPGYCGRLQLTQNLSAVTAACMLFRRAVFDEVGRLDDVNLTVAFNDVDLCLKMCERGYRIVWTPFAELYHWESVSRGSDLAPEKVERFRREIKYLNERWPGVIARDPYYSPNLTIDGENFTLAFPPRFSPPWRQTDRV